MQADTVTIRPTSATALYFDLTPDGRFIIFDLLGQLWEIPVAGGTARALTDAVAESSDDRQPSVSPDGKWIATRSDRPAGRGIWLHAREGHSVRQLTDSATILGYDVGVPSWSPAGDRIAFSQAGKIVLLDVATGRSEQLQIPPFVNSNLDEPVWSPDGKHLLVTGPWAGGAARALLDGPPGAAIWEIDLSDRSARRLSAEGEPTRAPSYSPDGKRITYFIADSSGTFRLVMQTPGDAAVEVTAEAGIEPRRVRWSSDGAALFFVAKGKLRRMSVAGAARADIPFQAELRIPRAHSTRRAPPLPGSGDTVTARGFTGLALSPDGKSIGMLALGKLWLIDLQGRVRVAATVMPSAKGLTWSPDGTQVAWSGGPLAAQDVYITDVSAGTSKRVTRSAGSDSGAAWSPDGRWIAFMHNDNRIHLVDMKTRADSSESVGPKMPWGEYAAFAEVLQWTPTGDTLLVYGMNGWPVASRACVTAQLVPLKGEPRTLTRFPCRPGHATLAYDGTLLTIENGVLTERVRTSDGWAEPHRVGVQSALYPSVSRDYTLLFVASNGLRVRDKGGRELHIGWPVRQRVPSVPPLRVRNVRLVPIDAGVDTVLYDILIVNGRIASITHAGTEQSRVASNVKDLDAAGRWVIPGLVDTHTHFLHTGLAQPRAELYHGVTTMREMWHPLADAAAFRDDVAAGVVPGARIVVSGPPFYPAPTIPSVTSDFLWVPVDSLTADHGLAMLSAFGAGHVKMRYTQTWSAAATLLRRAHSFGLRIGGHCAHALVTVAAGIDTHEHADGQCGDWEFGIHEDIAQLYRAANITAVPVIDVHDEARRVARDTLRLYAPDVAAFRAGLPVEGPGSQQALRRLERRASRARAATAFLHQAGVRIAIGSDAEALPGGIPRELEALVAAGLTPADALRAATSNAAAVLGLDNKIGKLARGFRADLVLLDANPLVDIRNVRRIWTIIQEGKVIERAALMVPLEERF